MVAREYQKIQKLINVNKAHFNKNISPGKS